MTTVLFWDIDLTLLSTARAGIYAVEDAVREVLGIDADLQQLFTSGLTDFQVMKLAAESTKVRAAVFYPSGRGLLDTGLWTSDRNRPAALARERPRSTPAMTYAYLVERPGLEKDNLLRVKPGDPAASLLIDKLRDRNGVATQMPLGAEPLPEADIAARTAAARTAPSASTSRCRSISLAPAIRSCRILSENGT